MQLDNKILSKYKKTKAGKLLRGSQIVPFEAPTIFSLNSLIQVKAKEHSSIHSIKFLVDSGASISVLPYPRFQVNQVSHNNRMLLTANKEHLKCYGQRRMSFTIAGLPNLFIWTFEVANVSQAILGADFFAEHDLLIDCKTRSIRTKDLTTVVNACNCVEKKSELPAIIERELKAAKTITQAQVNVKHYINTGNSQPIAQRCRKLFGAKLDAVKEHFKTLERQGIIRPSKSPWASPLVVVTKRDGSYRPCGDYRKLNNHTVPDQYPLPTIEDLLHTVAKGKWFSKIDLTKAYNQVPMSEEDVMKTAIITPFGLFEWTRMPFGLKCAAQTFQRLMDQVFRPLEDCARAYIDDVVIFSDTSEQHIKDVVSVFKAAKEAGLAINKDKCEFIRSSIQFLGFEVTHQQIKPLDSRVASIKQLQHPKNLKELRKFIGMVGFYHRFTPKLPNILAPLHDLVAKS